MNVISSNILQPPYTVRIYETKSNNYNKFWVCLILIYVSTCGVEEIFRAHNKSDVYEIHVLMYCWFFFINKADLNQDLKTVLKHALNKLAEAV